MLKTDFTDVNTCTHRRGETSRLKMKTQRTQQNQRCQRCQEKSFTDGNSSKMNTEMSNGIPIEEAINDFGKGSFKDTFLPFSTLNYCLMSIINKLVPLNSSGNIRNPLYSTWTAEHCWRKFQFLTTFLPSLCSSPSQQMT